jgi:hypothetical protein
MIPNMIIPALTSSGIFNNLSVFLDEQLSHMIKIHMLIIV